MYKDVGAALGTDAEQEISPERAAQAVSPLQGCSQLITPDPRVSPWAGLHRPFKAYILNFVPLALVRAGRGGVSYFL